MITGLTIFAGANLQQVCQNADTGAWITTIPVELNCCYLFSFKIPYNRIQGMTIVISKIIFLEDKKAILKGYNQ